MDGSFNRKGCEARVILKGPNQMTLEKSVIFGFKTSINQAKYEVLLVCLRLAMDVGAKKIKCWSDSKVADRQINGEYQVKNPNS